MSAFAALTLPNNAAVNVVFSPQSIDSNGVATWMTQDSVYDARSVITSSLKLPKNNSSMVRIKERIVVPVMDSVNPSLKLGESIVNIDVALYKGSSETHRLDLRKYAEKLIADAINTAAFQKLESIY